MNPVFDPIAPCLICEKDKWNQLSIVKHTKLTFDLKICNVCGFVSQNPPLSNSFLKDYYKDNYVSENYNNSLDEIHQMDEPAKARIKYLKDKNYIINNSKYMEIGPGAGTMMKLLSNEGIDIVGIEPDPIAAKWMEEKKDLKIYEGFFDEIYDREKEKWRNTLFDAIVFTHVLEHISNPIIFLKKIKSILKDKSILIIEVPNIERPFTDEWNWQAYCDPGHLYYFSKVSLGLVLNKAGFSVISMTDKLFEPFGNLFCIAKIQTNNVTLKQGEISANKPEDITKIWKNYVKYHKIALFKYKISRIIRKINANKLKKVN